MKANCLPATAAAAAAAAATAAGGDGGGCLPPLGCSITLQIKETAKSRATVSARETTETPEPWFPLPGDLLAHLLSLVCVALFCCFCANQPRYLAPPLLKSPENNPNHSSSSLSLRRTMLFAVSLPHYCDYDSRLRLAVRSSPFLPSSLATACVTAAEAAT